MHILNWITIITVSVLLNYVNVIILYYIASSLGIPVINSVSRDSQDSSIVTVSWSSVNDVNGDFDSYIVHVTSSDGIDSIPFTQIAITGTEARIRGLYPGFSYVVTVLATTSSQSSSNQIILPSISAVSSITMGKSITNKSLVNFVECKYLGGCRLHETHSYTIALP